MSYLEEVPGPYDARGLHSSSYHEIQILRPPLPPTPSVSLTGSRLRSEFYLYLPHKNYEYLSRLTWDISEIYFFNKDHHQKFEVTRSLSRPLELTFSFLCFYVCCLRSRVKIWKSKSSTSRHRKLGPTCYFSRSLEIFCCYGPWV